jgi:P-type Ca2+ transporter type 2C
LDDNFSSIVAAVRLGRRIFDNLKKAMAYIVAVHVPIAGMSLIPIITNLPIVLFPAHIAFLELIIDPACSVVFEANQEERGIMERSPRNLKDPLFGKRTFFMSLMQGISVLVIVMSVFLYLLWRGYSESDARTVAFTTLVLSNLLLIMTNLSVSQHIVKILKEANRVTWGVIIGASVSLILILYIPFLRTLFHFTLLHPNDIFIILLAGTVGILWFEILKSIEMRRLQKVQKNRRERR